MSDMTTKYRNAFGPHTHNLNHEVKTYFVGIRGLNLCILTGLLNRMNGPKHIYYDGNQIWITMYDDDEIIQIGVPSECIEGDRQPFLVVNALTIHSTSFEDVVFRVAVNALGETHVQIMDVDPALNVWPTMPNWISQLPTCADTAELIGPTIDVNQLCHTWAISHELGYKIIRKVMSWHTKTKPLHACISARASNIGVTYYDWSSGEVVEEFKVLSTRYGGKYIGRSDSWKDVTGALSFSLFKENDKYGVMHVARYTESKAIEIYFPRANVPMARTNEGEELNIFGTNVNAFLCGIGVVKDSGVVIRSFKRRPYQKGYPLMDKPPKTTFKENYTPLAQPQSSWTLIGERLGDEDMTPKELETVKKWWAGYLQHLIRKGKVPSEEEVECARKLGVYTGK